jgi:hypothetical protein
MDEIDVAAQLIRDYAGIDVGEVFQYNPHNIIFELANAGDFEKARSNLTKKLGMPHDVGEPPSYEFYFTKGELRGGSIFLSRGEATTGHISVQDLAKYFQSRVHN